MSGTLGVGWQPTGDRVKDFVCRLGAREGRIDPMDPPLGTLQGGLDSRQLGTVAPAGGPLRIQCRPCGTATSDHDGPSQPAMSRSSAATAPVSFPGILAAFPIRADLAVSGNVVSPPVVAGRTGGRDPASLPGHWRPRSRCWPRPLHTRSEGLSSHLLRDSDRIQSSSS